MNEAASQLGQLAAGVPKNFSKAERKRRKKRMIALNLSRGFLKGNSHQRRIQKRAKRRAELNGERK